MCQGTWGKNMSQNFGVAESTRGKSAAECRKGPWYLRKNYKLRTECNDADSYIRHKTKKYETHRNIFSVQ